MSENFEARAGAQRAGEKLLSDHSAEDPFAAAFKATRMPMIITDPRQPDNPIIFTNRSFCELSGYSAEELIGRNCRLLQGEDTNRASVQRIRDAIAAEESIAIDLLNYRKDGSTFWNALFISPVRNSEGVVQYFFASQLDFTNVKNREAELANARSTAEQEVAERTRELERALRAKTMLVHEVDHRVKNNLLTIASILKLQSRLTQNPAASSILRTVLERVEALSIVQRKLFTTDDVEHFDVSDFTREIVIDMVSALKRDDITLSLDLSPVLVPASKASPFALIVNELVGDAVRRGLRDGGGHITVTVRRLNGHFLVQVTDTVEPVTVDAEEAELSRLILESCARQLGATIERQMDGRQNSVRVELLAGTPHEEMPR